MLTLILLIVAAILLTALVEHDALGWSLFTALCVIAYIAFIDKSITLNDAGTYISQNVGQIVCCSLGYIIIGVGWAILKWKWFLRRKYDRAFGRTPYHDEQHYHKDEGERYEDISKIYASDHRTQIICWMLWWPLSVIWYLVHNPITRLYNWIFDSLAKVFNGMSEAEKLREQKKRLNK